MKDILMMLLNGIPWTIAVTVLAFCVGVVLGFPICALRMSRVKVLSILAAMLVLTLRSIPRLSGCFSSSSASVAAISACRRLPQRWLAWG